MAYTFRLFSRQTDILNRCNPTLSNLWYISLISLFGCNFASCVMLSWLSNINQFSVKV